ncbi:MAG: PilZ domain-containing protein [Thermoanaerobaculia bacterium]|nr:PilZ domain-containing protein [Thermoanaerobaculia bacterium]
MAHAEDTARGLRRILAVGLEPALYGRIEALLNRSYFEVDKVPRGENGRVLCAAIAFDLVLVRYPLPDIDVTDLLAALRLPASPCENSQILLLADEPRLFQAERLVGQGANAAVATDKTGEFLSGFAAQLLAVAPRVASRIMVRLQARIGDGEHQAFCQTYDISRSGMFVRTDSIYSLGSMVEFELLLPEEREAVVGRADVVRHSAGGEGKPDGIGLRYIDFRSGSEARLTAFLGRAPASSAP